MLSAAETGTCKVNGDIPCCFKEELTQQQRVNVANRGTRNSSTVTSSFSHCMYCFLVCRCICTRLDRCVCLFACPYYHNKSCTGLLLLSIPAYTLIF